MTRADKSPVRRVVSAGRMSRELVVEVTADFLVLREKGRRTKYLTPWGVAFIRAAKDAADEARREKAALRKARKGARP